MEVFLPSETSFLPSATRLVLALYPTAPPFMSPIETPNSHDYCKIRSVVTLTLS